MKNNWSLAHRRGYWLRQLSDCAENSFQEVINTLKTYGGSNLALVQKVMDGTTWQGQIDPKTPLNDINDVQRLQSLCWQNNVSFVPIVVPRGETGESSLHASVAASCACLVVDIENGPGFYDHAPTSTIPAYWSQLRDGALDAYLVTQPDPRNLRSVYFSQSAPYFDGIAAQHYVGWEEVGWNDVVREVQQFDELARFGKDMYATLYGVGDWPTVSTFWRAIRDYSLGFQAFRFGVMDAQQLQQTGELLLP